MSHGVMESSVEQEVSQVKLVRIYLFVFKKEQVSDSPEDTSKILASSTSIIRSDLRLLSHTVFSKSLVFKMQLNGIMSRKQYLFSQALTGHLNNILPYNN